MKIDSGIGNTRYRWWWLAAVVAFAAATRLGYLVLFRGTDPFYDHLLHDARIYHQWASALARGEAFETGVFYQAPLYPYLVGFLYRWFGPSPGVAYLFQAALGLGSLLLVHRIGRRSFDSRAGIVAAALFALYGVLVFYETKLLPTALAVFVTCLVIERMQAADASEFDGWWLAAGVVLGAAALARPNLLLLAPLVLVWIGVNRSRPWPRRLRRGLLCLAGVIAAVAPVTARNYLVAGDPVLISANAGITFYQGNNREAGGRFSATEGMSGSIFRQRDESRALAEERAGRRLTESEVSRYWLGRGLDYIREDPVRYLRLEGRKLLLALDNYEHGLEYNPAIDPNPVRFLAPLPFALILGLAVARGFSGRSVAREETPLYLLIAVQAATLLLFYVAGRYRLPAIGPLSVVAGCGAVVLWTRIHAGWKASWKPLTVGAVAATISFAPVPSAGSSLYRLQQAQALDDRGGAYVEAGRIEEAVEAYRAAIESDPDYPFAHLDLGKALRTLGDHGGAERALREAIRLAPRMGEPHFDLGVVLYETGRLEEAADAFEAALALDPTDASAGNNLIGTCLRIGRRETATETWKVMRERGLAVDPALENWLERSDER
jgi:tetratricopeptide (TPR) repeat protein